MIDSLVIGASGLVGNYLHAQLLQSGQRVIGTSTSSDVPTWNHLDARDRRAVDAIILEHQPQTIFLPAAQTNVDYCEQHPQEAYQVNVAGLDNVIQAANRAGARLICFSSDYIFNGVGGPYSEEDLPQPVCQYGWQKLLAEYIVTLHAKESLIIRTTVIYGWESRGKNFIYRLLKTLRESKTLRVPSDQVGTPTCAPNLAAAVVELAGSRTTGIYNIAGPHLVNRYQLAVEAAKIFGLDASLIQPALTKDLGQIAPRPLQAGLKINKAQKVLRTPLLGYLDGLRLMFDTRPREWHEQ